MKNQQARNDFFTDLESIIFNHKSDVDKVTSSETFKRASLRLMNEAHKIDSEIAKEATMKIEYLIDSFGGKECTMQSLTN